jgi:hypothetical protein
MKTHLPSILLLLLCAISASARLMPVHPMDQLAFASGFVVYCEETDIREGVERRTLIKCKVLQSFKGELVADTEFTADYSHVYKRLVGASAEPKRMPKGKALLFLQKDESGNYKVLDAKLVVNGKVFRFIQFDNPGPLLLNPQAPENIKPAESQSYGEKELLEDLAAALKKATTLKPDEVHAGEAM